MNDQERQIAALATLLQLEKSFRNADTAEALAYTLVNDSRSLITFRQAALWRIDSSEVVAISGLAVIDANAPYIIWLKQVFKQLSPDTSANIRSLTAEDLQGSCAEEWPQWLPAHALWLAGIGLRSYAASRTVAGAGIGLDGRGTLSARAYGAYLRPCLGGFGAQAAFLEAGLAD